MNKEECNYCVKRKTVYCPNSNECYSLDNLPYFQTKLDVLKENNELKEDISFCLHSIKQEMEMSTDSRTRNEMTSCYDILKRWSK